MCVKEGAGFQSGRLRCHRIVLSAADIIKQAMLNVQRALISESFKSRLLLQVHDELILEVVAGEEDLVTELVRREMGAAYPLKAPLDVSVGIGKSWNEAAH